MRIVVCIKQVPVVSALGFDPATKTVKRDGVRTEVSAFDVRALLKAVELKQAHGAEVVVLTMGPPQARSALQECLALGADRAVHLCDRAFAGADTLATARTLAHALRRESADLVLCGRHSVDAETGQVGPEIAELLALPQITAVCRLDVDPATRRLTATRETDAGFETVSAPLPAVVTAAEDLAAERFPTKVEREAATAKPCIELHAADLPADPSEIGAAGSPTTVVDLQPVENSRLGRIVDAPSADAAAAALVRLLHEEHGLFGAWKIREQPVIATIASHPPRTAPRDVWVLAETLGGVLRPVVFELLGKARDLAHALDSHVTAVLLGHEIHHHAATLAAYGADHVLVADDPRFVPFLVDVHAAVLADAIRTRGPGVILAPSTGMGRDLAPRVAARLQLGLTGDCIDIGLDAAGRVLHYKPAFGGSIVAPIVSRTVPEMATVRPGMLPMPAPDTTRHAAPEALAFGPPPSPVAQVIEQQAVATDATALDHADVVIGVGTGIGGVGQLGAIRPLAEALGAALCTTRDVTDKGWLPKHLQVGLTGRAIAPKLYVAIGIRGAFEHMVGVRRAGTIVAINTNAKAPVFKSADYGIVGDYAEVVPALCAHLAALKAHRES